jgi:hypothetical protein
MTGSKWRTTVHAPVPRHLIEAVNLPIRLGLADDSRDHRRARRDERTCSTELGSANDASLTINEYETLLGSTTARSCGTR